MDTAYRVGPLHPGDPERLGDYLLAGRLGAGGMGVVYLGRGPDGAQVAIKTVHAGLARQREFRERFRGEVARAQQVPSFCTAEVLGADLDHDPAYLVTEYVDGPSLAEVVRDRGPLTAANLRALAVGVATALVGIHGAGVIHRDLKPENVLLPPGNPKVIDFGIARPDELTGRHTATDVTVGTVAYMAPERLTTSVGGAVTSAADVFAWGCLVGYAGLGHSPFQDDSPVATAERIVTGEPALDGLTEPLRAVVEAALVKEPMLRPTARELLDLLLDADQPATPPVPPASAAEPRTAEPRAKAGVRWRIPAAVASTVLVLGGAAGFALRDDGEAGAPVPPGAGPTGSAGVAARTVYIDDALRTPSAFPAVETPSHDARCEVTDMLIVTRQDRGSYTCPGPEVIIREGFSAKVTAYLRSRGTCAAIRFNWNPGRGGNVLHVCQQAISVTTVTGATTTRAGTLPAAQRIFLNRPAQIRFTVDGGVVTVFRGGGRVGEVRLPAGTPAEGKFRLGIEVEDEGGRAPFSVAYTDLAVAAL